MNRKEKFVITINHFLHMDKTSSVPAVMRSDRNWQIGWA